MGKIGDLIVRLKLKDEDYEKGLKKADKETKEFEGGLGKGIGKIAGAWAAVGVAVVAAAKKMVSEMAKASNNVGDYMAVKAKQINAIWSTMLTSLTAGFDNFQKRAESAARAAEALQNAQDAEYEMLNSVKLMRAELESQLIKWEIESKDATKSYADRKKAAEQYLTAVQKIYKVEMDYYKDLSDQATKTWLESTSTPKGRIIGYTDYNAKVLFEFLKDYGSNKGLAQAVANYRAAVKAMGEAWNYAPAGKAAMRWVNETRATDMAEVAKRRLQLDMGWAYEEQMNDERNGANLVDIIEKYLRSVSAYDSETKKMQNNLNSLTAKLDKDETANTIDSQAESVNYLATSLEELNAILSSAVVMAPMPDIIPDDWLTRNREKIDAAVAEAERMRKAAEEITNQFNTAVVDSMSGATQALTECIMGVEGVDATQVLAALVDPFGQTLISLGEMLIATGAGVEAFKTSLESLQGGAAVAAGVALIALGTAMSAGIRALAGGVSSSATSAAGYNSATSSGSGVETYEQEITVYVVGEISGDKIVLSGQKALNKWKR